MTRKDLAARSAMDPQAVDEIIRGERAIDPETAVKLADALGIGARYWLGLESDYGDALARNGTRAAPRAADR